MIRTPTTQTDSSVLAVQGNSIQSMDLGFALQARSLERIGTAAASLSAGAQPVPDDINRQLAQQFVQTLQSGRTS